MPLLDPLLVVQVLVDLHRQLLLGCVKLGKVLGCSGHVALALLVENLKGVE